MGLGYSGATGDDTGITLGAGNNIIGQVRIADGDGTTVADVLDLAAVNPLAVAIVDGTGAQITSFGGGVQYTEGDVDTSITGTAAMMEVAGDVLEPIQGTVADGLLVNLGANNDVAVTGSVTAVAQPGVDIGDVTVNNAGGAAAVNIQDGGNSITVDGSVTSIAQPGVDIGDVTVNNGAGAAAVNIQDGGNSLTVDAVDLDIRNLVFATDKVDVSGSTGVGVTGTFFQATQPVSAVDLDIRDLVFATDKVDVSGSAVTAAVTGTVTANQGTPAATANRWPVQITDGTDLALVTAAGEQNVLATAQPGVDIGDVTVNNAGGAAAVNIQDGGNSITVDGTLTTTATDFDIRDLVFATDKVDVSGSTVDTELPPAVLLSDSLSNPTVPGVGAYTLLFDGTAAWGRLRRLLNGTNSSGLGALQAGILGQFDDVSPNSLSENSFGNIRVSVNRNLYSTIRDAAGNERGANVTAANELSVTSTAQPGVDIGDVTVNNGAGAAAVNIQDGGNSLTVDNTALSVIGGGTEATALRVTIANDSTGVLSIDDNGGSLTVDAVDLDIRNLAFATDKVDVTGSIVSTKTPLTPSAPTSVGVSSFDVAIVVAAATRKGLVITNLSAYKVALAFGNPAVVGSGIILYPGGTFYMDEYSFNTSEVRAISYGLAGQLAIQEFLV